MKVIVSMTVQAEDGVTLDPAEVAKDAQLYMMDFAQNVAAIEPVDITGGWYVIEARAGAAE